MLTPQLTLCQTDVQVIQENNITLYRCDRDAARWITPDTPCPMCHPSQETATCDRCGCEFTDSRYMIETMRIGGQVLCGVCLPRMTADDFRESDTLHREAEISREQRLSEREAAKGLAFQPTTDD